MSSRRPDPASDDDSLRRALALLVEAARERLRALGNGGAPREPLGLELRLPLAGGEESLAASARDLGRQLDEELRALVAARSLWPPGRVFCARCGTPACTHSAPPDARSVFAGWGPSGLPRWSDFGQLLLERQHPRVAEVYADRPPLVALAMSGDELLADLLPAYREQLGALRLHGQVAAGWYRPRPSAPAALRSSRPAVEAGRVAIAFQVLSAGSGRRRRFALHPVGATADAAVLETLHDERGRLPWADARRWAEATLAEIAGGTLGMGLPEGARVPAPAAIEARLGGLLRHLAERLERPQRAGSRRTTHAQERHHQGRRPTPAAVADLRDTPPERVLFDARHQTFVVLGPRGRTHVFAPEGKLVTSVRYPAATIDRRQKLGHWQGVTAEQAAALVARVEELVGAAAGDS